MLVSSPSTVSNPDIEVSIWSECELTSFMVHLWLADAYKDFFRRTICNIRVFRGYLVFCKNAVTIQVWV
jgi:hypothetical protein